MIYSDFYNLSQFRQDGRKHNQLRSLVVKTGLSGSTPNPTNEETHLGTHLERVQGGYQGSSYVKMGLTEVVCLVKGPMSQTQQAGEGVISIKYVQPPFSSSNRKPPGKISK